MYTAARMLPMRKSAVVMALSVCALPLGVAQSAHGALPETLLLDSYSDGQDGDSGPVQTTDSLAVGAYYTATVTGTYSPFTPSLWIPVPPRPRPICGTPESDAQIPSPGRPSSRVGADAATTFARPKPLGAGCPALPRARTAFEIADQGVFAYRTPIGGQPTAPSAQHLYRFLLAGSGAPAQFRLRDDNVLDNYGVLSITVRGATVEDCAGLPPCIAAVTTRLLDGGDAPATTFNAPPPPAAVTCTSRRRFRINVRFFPHDPVVAATIRSETARGRRLKVTRVRGRLGTTLSFVGHPEGRVAVYIFARTRSGKLKTGARTYRLCAERTLPLTLPKL